MAIVLFDIDGTLIDSQGAGQKALVKSLYELTGKNYTINPLLLAGRTDFYIIQYLLNQYFGGYSAKKHEELLNLYLYHLEKEIEQSPPRILPGVITVLNSLKEQGVKLGLLTGNVERGAQIKLGPLFGYFSFGFYGDWEEDRNLLGIKARNWLNEDFWIVGDTPHDISCGRSGGGKIIAVATGHYKRHELSGADFVLNSLEEWFLYWK